MKYSKTAIKELRARYLVVLKKCLMINAIVLCVSVPALADTIIIDKGQTDTISNVTITGQHSDSWGGGINSSGDDVVVDNVTFTQNSAVYAGGGVATGYNNNGAPGGSMTISNSTFDQNTGEYGGGALANYGILNIKDSTFTNNKVTAAIVGDNTDLNTSVDGGGALFVGSASTTSSFTTSISSSIFDSNSSSAAGGAIATRADYDQNKNLIKNKKAVLNISNSTFSNNHATTEGGAIYNTFYKTSLTDVVFTGNSADNHGGAISNVGQMTIGGNISFGALDANGNAINGNSSKTKGGAIYTDGTLNVGDNALFAGNTAVSGAGAIYSGNNRKGITPSTTPDAITTTIGNNARFIGNSVTGTGDSSGGAIGNHTNSTMIIGNNALFKENTSAVAGGAISNSYNIPIGKSDAEATLHIGDGVQFIGNMASQYGGAVHNEQKMTIGSNAVFQSNIATSDRGGAIANAGWDGISAILTIGDNALFGGDTAALGNTSVNGGAIYNKLGETTDTSIVNLGNGVQFKNNVATTGNGGAIFNGAGAEINFAGDATFVNNTANGAKNDIHNEGTLNFNGGTVTLDGGITGNGTVTFADGTSLKTALLADASNNAIITANTLSGQVNLVVENGSTGGQVKFDATDNTLAVSNTNALYDISGTNGLYSVTKKDDSQIMAATGASQTEANAVSALTSGTANNEQFNTISEAVNTLMQSSNPADVAQGIKAAGTLAPTTAPVTTATVTQNVNQVFGAVSTRLSGGAISSGTGKSSGDEIIGNGAVWAQALYNKSKLDKTNGFDAYSKGIALGAEGHINDVAKIGVGYAYTNSDVKPDDRKTEIDSNTAMIYGEYKPNNWYVNAIASYTWGRYDDHKYVLGTDVRSKYDVNSFASQIMTGYDFNVQGYTLTPEAGLRYVNVDQKASTDTAGNRLHSNKSDVFTGVIGAKASTSVWVDKDISLKPEVRVAATYDFVNDDVTSVMTLANASVISSNGKALKKFGTEVGLGLTAEITDRVELGIGYEGKFRADYQDHTGMITAKYNF